jgi:hypothetical protein
VVAIVIVGIILFGGGGSYSVKARFQNAAQLVSGNQVEIGGTPVGSVKEIRLTDEGQAEVTLEVKDDHKPLPEGTGAVIRQASQSGIANRYVELQLPPGRKDGRQPGNIPDGGRIPITKTTTAVELDQLFNTLDPETRSSRSSATPPRSSRARRRSSARRSATSTRRCPPPAACSASSTATTRCSPASSRTARGWSPRSPRSAPS